MEFYRYEERLIYDIGLRIYLQTYILDRETEKGYWIISKYGGSRRWVSKTAKKRFAYPTKELAKQSFEARKKRQVEILTARLKNAQLALDAIRNSMKHYIIG